MLHQAFSQCDIGALDKGLLDLCLTLFASHFGVSALCLKCTEHVDRNSFVVRRRINVVCPKISCSWLAEKWDVNWWRNPPVLVTQQDQVDIQ